MYCTCIKYTVYILSGKVWWAIMFANVLIFAFGEFYSDIVEAHCYFVDIGRTDREQIRSRINNNDCRTFRPRRPLSTAYRTESYSDRLPETMQSNGRQNHLICLEQGWNE